MLMVTNPPPPTPPNQPDKQDVGRVIAQGLAAALIATATRQRQPGGGEKDRTFRLWLLGLVPIIFASLRLIIVARGDPETLRSLVQSLNITALVLATVLPLGATVVTWTFLLLLLSAVTRPQLPQNKEGRRVYLVLLVVFAVFVDCFAMTLIYGLINLAIFAAFILLTVSIRWSLTRPPPWPERAQKFARVSAQAWTLVFLLGPLLIWLGAIGMWLPQERLTVGATHIEPVYVLSYDDRWLKYMNGAHQVHIVPTKDVTSRETLGASGSTWRKTPFDLWQAWWTNRHHHEPAPPSSKTPTTSNAPTPTRTPAPPRWRSGP
jgi:hypothetical protein